MKKLEIVIILIFIINVIIGIDYIKISKEKKLQALNYNNCIKNNTEKKLLADYFLRTFESQKDSWNFLLPQELAKYTVGEKLLCLRISYRNCSKCIETELENLKKIKKTFDIDKIIIMGDFPDSRQIDIFIDNYKIPYQVIKCTNININIESLNMPYYFLLIDDRIQYPFIPIKRYPKITEMYFNNISTIIN